MKLIAAGIFLLATLSFLAFNYTSVTQDSHPLTGPNLATYNLVQAQGKNKGQVLERIQKQVQGFGEATNIAPLDKSIATQQVFIFLPLGQSKDTYRLVMVGDNGESLALTEYDNDNNVYVRTNLIEDKLDKWWQFSKNSDGKTYTIQNTADIKNTYLCGAGVQSSNSDDSCVWELQEAELPF